MISTMITGAGRKIKCVILLWMQGQKLLRERTYPPTSSTTDLTTKVTGLMTHYNTFHHHYVAGSILAQPLFTIMDIQYCGNEFSETRKERQDLSGGNIFEDGAMIVGRL
jgi:hypothetical protein